MAAIPTLTSADPVPQVQEAVLKPAVAASHLDALEFSRATHSNLQDMVKVADAKATTLVSLQALVLAFVGADLVSLLGAAIKSLASTKLAPNQTPEILVLVAVLALVLTAASSAFCAVMVLVPRFPKHLKAPKNAKGLMWLDALLPHVESPSELNARLGRPKPAEEYVQALLTMVEAERVADFAFENLKIAWILKRKFHWLKIAVHVLFAAMASALLTLIAWTIFVALKPELLNLN